MLNGQSAELNQVSSTSGSWVSAEPAHDGQDAGCVRATMGVPRSRSSPPVGVRGVQALQYQAGIWCPHHSCRLTHQSWMLRIQWK